MPSSVPRPRHNECLAPGSEPDRRCRPQRTDGARPHEEPMQSRRLVVGVLLASLSLPGYAQTGGGPFVGIWKGEVPGIGESTMTITAVGQNGQVEGRMEFALQSYSAAFADKYDVGRQTNSG